MMGSNNSHILIWWVQITFKCFLNFLVFFPLIHELFRCVMLSIQIPVAFHHILLLLISDLSCYQRLHCEGIQSFVLYSLLYSPFLTNSLCLFEKTLSCCVAWTNTEMWLGNVKVDFKVFARLLYLY